RAHPHGEVRPGAHVRTRPRAAGRRRRLARRAAADLDRAYRPPRHPAGGGTMNPDLDLALDRVIRAPRAAGRKAWTGPGRFAKWWITAGARCRVDCLEVRAGGGLVTRISEDGAEFAPHMDATFVVAEELTRIVFTTALDSSWRPADPGPIVMTAE